MKTYKIAFTGPSYTFTGADAEARISTATDGENGHPSETSFYGNLVSFSAFGKLKVKKARISMLGAEGIHAGANGAYLLYGPCAAVLKFGFTPNTSDGDNHPLGGFDLPIAMAMGRMGEQGH